MISGNENIEYEEYVYNKYLKKKVNESEVVYSEYDFLGMQAQAANMTREEWIAHYGTPDVGTGIE